MEVLKILKTLWGSRPSGPFPPLSPLVTKCPPGGGITGKLGIINELPLIRREGLSPLTPGGCDKVPALVALPGATLAPPWRCHGAKSPCPHVPMGAQPWDGVGWAGLWTRGHGDMRTHGHGDIGIDTWTLGHGDGHRDMGTMGGT